MEGVIAMALGMQELWEEEGAVEDGGWMDGGTDGRTDGRAGVLSAGAEESSPPSSWLQPRAPSDPL